MVSGVRLSDGAPNPRFLPRAFFIYRREFMKIIYHNIRRDMEILLHHFKRCVPQYGLKRVYVAAVV